MTTDKVNSQQYWERRFGTGDWEHKGGYEQSRLFAESQVTLFGIPGTFDGQICDFGCGAGDALPVYRKAFPRAKLVGVDFSESAISLCSQRYGSFATFLCGSVSAVPISDVIVCSNVAEHLPDDHAAIGGLLERCKRLLVIVPYREQPLSAEHVRTYDRSSLARFAPVRTVIHRSAGWSEYGWALWWGVYIKNAVRGLLGRSLLTPRRQILFEFEGLKGKLP